jgi:hypothetical protein
MLDFENTFEPRLDTNNRSIEMGMRQVRQLMLFAFTKLKHDNELYRPLTPMQQGQAFASLGALETAFRAQGNDSPVKDFKANEAAGGEIVVNYRIEEDFTVAATLTGLQEHFARIICGDAFEAKLPQTELYGLKALHLTNPSTGIAHQLTATPYTSTDTLAITTHIQSPNPGGIGTATPADLEENNLQAVKFISGEVIKYGVNLDFAYLPIFRTVKSVLPFTLREMASLLHETGHGKSPNALRPIPIKSIYETTDFLGLMSILNEEDFANLSSLADMQNVVDGHQRSPEIMKRLALEAATNIASYYMVALIQNKLIALSLPVDEGIYGVDFKEAMKLSGNFQTLLVQAFEEEKDKKVKRLTYQISKKIIPKTKKFIINGQTYTINLPEKE